VASKVELLRIATGITPDELWLIDTGGVAGGFNLDADGCYRRECLIRRNIATAVTSTDSVQRTAYGSCAE
jgi:hypothetical protein